MWNTSITTGSLARVYPRTFSGDATFTFSHILNIPPYLPTLPYLPSSGGRAGCAEARPVHGLPPHVGASRALPCLSVPLAPLPSRPILASLSAASFH